MTWWCETCINCLHVFQLVGSISSYRWPTPSPKSSQLHQGREGTLLGCGCKNGKHRSKQHGKNGHPERVFQEDWIKPKEYGCGAAISKITRPPGPKKSCLDIIVYIYIYIFVFSIYLSILHIFFTLHTLYLEWKVVHATHGQPKGSQTLAPNHPKYWVVIPTACAVLRWAFTRIFFGRGQSQPHFSEKMRSPLLQALLFGLDGANALNQTNDQWVPGGTRGYKYHVTVPQKKT